MSDDFDTTEEALNEWIEGDGVIEEPTDPFEGVSKHDQDLFFRVLDLLPREQLEKAMDYFMSNPSKIQAVAKYVRHEKELLEQQDMEGLKRLFEQERIVLDQADRAEFTPVHVEE